MLEVRPFQGGYLQKEQGSYLQTQQVIDWQRFMIDLMHSHPVQHRRNDTVRFENKDLFFGPKKMNCVKGNSKYWSMQEDQRSMCVSQPALRSSRDQCTNPLQVNHFVQEASNFQPQLSTVVSNTNFCQHSEQLSHHKAEFQQIHTVTAFGRTHAKLARQLYQSSSEGLNSIETKSNLVLVQNQKTQYCMHLSQNEHTQICGAPRIYRHLSKRTNLRASSTGTMVRVATISPRLNRDTSKAKTHFGSDSSNCTRVNNVKKGKSPDLIDVKVNEDLSSAPVFQLLCEMNKCK